jgi:cystathionine beta-lyase/cystathionine gamma-synthase
VHTQHSETKAARGAVRAGQEKRPRWPHLIYQTSTFEVTDNDEQVRATGIATTYYTRYGNPTNTAVGERPSPHLEGVDAALTFASGMGAITTTLMALLKSGDHVVAQRDIYGGT